jgi:hypothetical protein
VNKEITSLLNTQFNKFTIKETQDADNNTLFVEIEHYSIRKQSTMFECFSTIKEQQAYIDTAIKYEEVEKLMQIFQKYESEVTLYQGDIGDVILEDAYPELATAILKHLNQE